MDREKRARRRQNREEHEQAEIGDPSPSLAVQFHALPGGVPAQRGQRRGDRRTADRERDVPRRPVRIASTPNAARTQIA